MLQQQQQWNMQQPTATWRAHLRFFLNVHQSLVKKWIKVAPLQFNDFLTSILKIEKKIFGETLTL